MKTYQAFESSWRSLSPLESWYGGGGASDAGDRAQLSQVLFALGTGFDQRLDFEVDARDELIEARSQRLEIGSESVQFMQRHCEHTYVSLRSNRRS